MKEEEDWPQVLAGFEVHDAGQSLGLNSSELRVNGLGFLSGRSLYIVDRTDVP